MTICKLVRADPFTSHLIFIMSIRNFTIDTYFSSEEVVRICFQNDEAEKVFMEAKEMNAMRMLLHRFWNRVGAYLKVVNHSSYLQYDAAKGEL